MNSKRASKGTVTKITDYKTAGVEPENACKDEQKAFALFDRLRLR